MIDRLRQLGFWIDLSKDISYFFPFLNPGGVRSHDPLLPMSSVSGGDDTTTIDSYCSINATETSSGQVIVNLQH
jgi:hypothetical protein